MNCSFSKQLASILSFQEFASSPIKLPLNNAPRTVIISTNNMSFSISGENVRVDIEGFINF